MPDFDECLSLAKQVINAEGLSEATLCIGSGYSGHRKTSDTAQDKELQELKRTVQQVVNNQAKAQRKSSGNNNGQGPSNRNNNQRGRSNRGKNNRGRNGRNHSLQNRLNSLCITYNSGAQCNDPCHMGKKHLCSK